MLQFDPNLPGLITGAITKITVIDPATNIGAPFELGNHVIDPTKAFDVKVDWDLDGLIVPLWITALGGNWDVSVYAESLGVGTEAKLGTALVPALPIPLDNTYTATVNVPAGSLLEHAPGTDRGGIYKLVVAVFLNSNLGGPPGFDIIGFSEGPIIQAENPL